ncbi:hypothetical protein [Mycobacteroides chelonae]|uniref:hypothetical protein n=1 Tax=Mycobacteroides chelonae TaxID=1774 RepID=UPI001042041F|nr:hypothetical protein [Mycobacteroides chelonae]
MHRRPAPLTDKQTFETNVEVLEQFGLRRALSILTAICTVAIGAAAMTSAFEGFSTIPALCVVIALPTLGMGHSVCAAQTHYLRRVVGLAHLLRYRHHGAEMYMARRQAGKKAARVSH